MENVTTHSPVLQTRDINCHFWVEMLVEDIERKKCSGSASRSAVVCNDNINLCQGQLRPGTLWTLLGGCLESLRTFSGKIHLIKRYRFYFIVGFAVVGVDNKSYHTACETGKMIL